MSPLRVFRFGAAALSLVMLAGCAGTRPLPKYEKPLAHTQHQTIRTTAYTHSESDHRQYGRRTATGASLRSGTVKSAAADWSRFPAGTLFRTEETGELYEVDDYGWALAGTNTIDLYKPSRSAMNAWGVRRVRIEILRWGSVAVSQRILSGRSKYAHVRRMLEGIRNDNKPFEPLRGTTPSSELANLDAEAVPVRVAEPLAPRQAPTPMPARTAPELVSVRKPFRP